MDMIETVARALARNHGDDFDNIPRDKPHWIKERGQFGGRFRDINERFQCDYLDDARAAIEAMREPTKAMIEAHEDYPFMPEAMGRMIDAALKEKSPATP